MSTSKARTVGDRALERPSSGGSDQPTFVARARLPRHSRRRYHRVPHRRLRRCTRKVDDGSLRIHLLVGAQRDLLLPNVECCRSDGPVGEKPSLDGSGGKTKREVRTRIRRCVACNPSRRARRVRVEITNDKMGRPSSRTCKTRNQWVKVVLSVCYAGCPHLKAACLAQPSDEGDIRVPFDEHGDHGFPPNSPSWA
jgi:hypothetical protein